MTSLEASPGAFSETLPFLAAEGLVRDQRNAPGHSAERHAQRLCQGKRHLFFLL